MKLLSLLSLLCLAVLPLPAHAAASLKELLSSGHADQAIRILEQETRNSTPDAESYNLLCRAYYMIDDWDHGITACEHAVRLNPENSSYHLWLGRIYGEKADHAGFLSGAGLAKKVRIDFERAVELDPKSSEARADLAQFYLQAPSIVGGGKDKARAQVQALAGSNPAVADYVTGQIAEKEKDAEKNAAFRAEVEKTLLAPCIAKYVKNDQIKEIAKRAAWLGNDETHYVRKWEGKDLEDLKKLIALTIHWIEMEKLTADVIQDMPDAKTKATPTS